MDCTFEELPIRTYFYFQKGNIRKKISKRKYIWIKNENDGIIYCNSDKDELKQDRWMVNNKTSKVVKVNFKY